MKKKNIMYALVPVIALGMILGVQAVSAHGWFGMMGNATPAEIATRQQSMFQQQADLLEVSVDDVKDAWAQGKTMRELAQEKGITDAQLQEKMKAQRETQMKAHLQALLNQGVITQAQADQRTAWMSQQAANGIKGFGMRGHGGFGFRGGL
ncbi:hypothetical protein A3I42_04720 [Candidatus Uhrbacteria bacterium RIFCSPLOWO2_02_FULL_49_11]|uniref:DUF2680 domain-containing protein n=1 Tax=Candidatus Uhrbacteria bacterium RIFCSPLOWO2_02_FULL_49_11 TaxID=1802409 RepID=A0A1F7VEX6_9BACT|nr:MAG: hypothetical protein A3I42_04720 [Candidatus Uhrbacteria bacterium RIFCSPLOWO2_02_FULL_49_11]